MVYVVLQVVSFKREVTPSIRARHSLVSTDYNNIGSINSPPWTRIQCNLRNITPISTVNWVATRRFY